MTSRFARSPLCFRSRLATLAQSLALLAIVAARSGAQSVDEVARGLNLTPPQVQELQRATGYPLERLAAMSPASLPRLLRRIRYPDIQRRRAEYEGMQYHLGDTPTPPGAASRALEQFRQLQLNVRRQETAGIPVGVPDIKRDAPLFAGISSGGWSWLGPGNVGGRTRAIVIHPETPETIWLGSTGGGVWRSDNGGQVWYPLDNALSNLVITCLVMQPGNPDCLVAGTGEDISEADWDPIAHGDGLFLTRDGGRTWKQLAATVAEDFDFVRQLSFSCDGKTLLAATRKGVFRSTDLGDSWTKTAEYSAGDVEFSPVHPHEALASGWHDGKIHFSTDGGATWIDSDVPDFKIETRLKNKGRVEMTYARANPSVVYAMINAGDGVLCRSTDGGRSFAANDVSRYQVFGPFKQGQYDNTIWAGDPTNANFVIVGGVDLYKSLDGGATLQLISMWNNPDSAHADQHSITSHPKFDGVTNKTVYFGNDGGIYRTDDVSQVGSDKNHGAGWLPLNNGYGVVLFYDVAGHAQTGTLVAGAQDNGTLRYTVADGVNKWSKWIGGDGGFCAADPTDPAFLYGQYVFLELHRSTPGGTSTYLISGQKETAIGQSDRDNVAWKFPPYQIDDARRGYANFIAPFILDPNDPSRLLAGGLSLWRSNDVKAPVTFNTGPKWARIKPPTMPPQERYFYFYLLSAIAVAPGKSNEIWVGHNNGEVYRTTTGLADAPQWDRVGLGALPQSQPKQNYWCQSIVVSPHDSQRVFVTFLSYTRNNVWLTTDGGATWKNVGPTLPAVGARTIAVHPRQPNFVYLGTDVGIFASEDGGLTWAPANQGPANCRTDKLLFLGDKLIAATFGRGVYSIEVKL